MAVQTPLIKGDQVICLRAGTYQGTTWSNLRVREGATGTITSVKSTGWYSVKFVGVERVVEVGRADLAPTTGPEAEAFQAEAAKKAAKAAAEKKAAEEAMKPKPGDILPDDPRIAWFWRKTTAWAEKSQYCSAYDTICDELGIPGRPREFKVSFVLDGLKMSADIKGQSAQIVSAELLAKFPEAKDIVADTNGRR